jgi:hypothetical protein
MTAKIHTRAHTRAHTCKRTTLHKDSYQPLAKTAKNRTRGDKEWDVIQNPELTTSRTEELSLAKLATGVGERVSRRGPRDLAS